MAKILLVDDDISTLQLVGTMLERQGHKIVAANNGNKAISLAQEVLPDLVLLDIEMPGPDGYQVTRTLKYEDKTSNIPIILFSAKTSVNDKIMGFEAGADDYITKPIHPAELMARIKVFLSKIGKSKEDKGLPPIIIGAKRIGLLGISGGIGTTTVGLNLAIRLHQIDNSGTAFAEFRPGLGSTAKFLGINKHPKINDILVLRPELIKFFNVEKALYPHNSGIKLLMSDFSPDNIDLSNNIDQLLKVFNLIPRISKYSFFDLGTELSEINKLILKDLDKIVLVINRAHNTIDYAHIMIKAMIALGISREKLQYLITTIGNVDIKAPISNIIEDFDIPLLGFLAPNPEVIYGSGNITRVPFVISHKDSIITNQITSMTEKLLD